MRLFVASQFYSIIENKRKNRSDAKNDSSSHAKIKKKNFKSNTLQVKSHGRYILLLLVRAIEYR